MILDSVHFRMSNNFLGLHDEVSRYEDSKAVIIPVPYDSTTSYRAGTREGPAALIAASRQVEPFDLDLKCEPLTQGIHTLPELEIDVNSPEETIKNLEMATTKVLNDGKFPVMIGGEHSLTPGCVRACSKKYKNLSVLQIDAHSDLRDIYEKSHNSHACAMRRCWDYAKLTQIGIRNTGIDEWEFIQQVGHDGIIWAEELLDPEKKWIDKAMNRLTENVYITVDLDGFDSSLMPATGTPEPGGMTWYQAMDILLKVVEERNVVGFDVVELAPIPGFIAPDFLAAKLVYKILSRVFNKNGWIK